MFFELSLALVVDSSEEDMETTAVQERTVQRDPGSQVHHHSHSTHSRPHWCFLRIWLLYSQSKWKLRWSDNMTFFFELSVWQRCPTSFRQQKKTSTPSWGWIWRGPCCFACHAKTQSCTPMTPLGERRFMKNTRSVRRVLVLCSDFCHCCECAVTVEEFPFLFPTGWAAVWDCRRGSRVAGSESGGGCGETEAAGAQGNKSLQTQLSDHFSFSTAGQLETSQYSVFDTGSKLYWRKNHSVQNLIFL